MSHESLGRVENIAIYPIKGAAAIQLKEAVITPSGIEGDREYMIVRASPNKEGVHEFLTQRDRRNDADRAQGMAILTQLRPLKDGNKLLLEWKSERIDMPSLETGIILKVNVHDNEMTGVDQGDEIALWLSKRLGTELRLVKTGFGFDRPVSQSYIKNDAEIRYQDGYPVHWLMQESVDELVRRGAEDVSWRSFRPNIVVTGAPAESEHLVHKGTIGGIAFDNPKPCDRCTVTNVEQLTGNIKENRVTQYLIKYKKWVNKKNVRKVIFGENMMPLARGIIRVGDEVVMTEKRDPPLKYS